MLNTKIYVIVYLLQVVIERVGRHDRCMRMTGREWLADAACDDESYMWAGLSEHGSDLLGTHTAHVNVSNLYEMISGLQTIILKKSLQINILCIQKQVNIDL